MAFGAPLVFAVSVAPPILRSLPDRAAAGAAIAAVLRSVCLAMEAAFVVLLLTTRSLFPVRRSKGNALLSRVPVLGFVSVLAVSFVVMPVLERLRAHPEADPSRTLFARYHALSTLFFAIAFLAALFLLTGTAAREDRPADQQ